MKPPPLQFSVPAKRGLGVGFGKGLLVVAVLVDIDQEPLAGTFRRDGVQPD